MEYFLTNISNRFEQQNEPKLPQSGGRLGSFCCRTRTSVDTGSNLKRGEHKAEEHLFSSSSYFSRSQSVPVFAQSRVEHLKSVPTDGENRVGYTRSSLGRSSLGHSCHR